MVIAGGPTLMMGRRAGSESLFYYFRIEDQVPENHLLRLIDEHIDFGFVHERLAATAQNIKRLPPYRFRAMDAYKPSINSMPRPSNSSSAAPRFAHPCKIRLMTSVIAAKLKWMPRPPDATLVRKRMNSDQSPTAGLKSLTRTAYRT
jgi:hypothetical protein